MARAREGVGIDKFDKRERDVQFSSNEEHNERTQSSGFLSSFVITHLTPRIDQGNSSSFSSQRRQRKDIAGERPHTHKHSYLIAASTLGKTKHTHSS
jgi:hypothetical protein